jgi:D-amino-acid dehydrogenase
MLAPTACSSSSGTAAATGTDSSLNTVEPGVLTVAIEPYAPYTEMKGATMAGLDADIITAIAGRLKLKVKTEVTDFAGMLAGVQSRRYDITTLHRPGLVHAFLSETQARHHLDIQKAMAAGRYDLPDEVVAGDQAHQLDPALSPQVRAAYLVRGEGVLDPRRLVQSLGDVVRKAGGRIHEHVEVTGFRRTAGRIVGVRTSLGDMACGAVVIAAGMWSHRLLRLLGHRLRMQAGKGYSFTVEPEVSPRHALYLGDHRIVSSPIATATRIAGTMELSGDNRNLDWRRIVAIARGSRHYLGRWFDDEDDLPRLIRDPWVGGRPLLPDGLPVIDRLPGHDNAFVATGHGMLGVTLGPATGSGLADYLRSGQRPAVLAPFRFR